MKEYSSPLVSCIECKCVKSSRGILSHFLTSHTKEGKERMEKTSQLGTKSSFCSKEWREKYKIPKEKQLNECLYCRSPTANPKFCSRSCSASLANSNKPKRKKTDRKKKETKPLKQRICVDCGRIDYTKAIFISDKCIFCNESVAYRKKCKFMFDLKTYEKEFDLTLLKIHGMFHPKNNPRGVSRDHKLSIDYGKKNNIDPKILSHPANCQIILQSENTRKRCKSSITLERLLVDIKEWDSKYGPQ